jgi:hypothetical protein
VGEIFGRVVRWLWYQIVSTTRLIASSETGFRFNIWITNHGYRNILVQQEGGSRENRAKGWERRAAVRPDPTG